MRNEINEECGVFAVAHNDLAVELTYYGLYALQHRGQESAGITYRSQNNLLTKKGMGLVSDVFDANEIKSMKSDMAIGHVRYSTTGQSRIENAQPLTVKMWQGDLSVAHNGNLINAGEIRDRLGREGSIFQTGSDSEVIPHLLAKCKGLNDMSAVCSVLRQLRGAYALVMLTPQGVFGAKDPWGIRPLCLGKLDKGYVLSSETCGLDAVGARFIRELEPGEVVRISGGKCESAKIPAANRFAMCVFEFIYFARPDSEIFGLNVHAARKALGKRLALKNECQADLVTGVPDSSLSAASGYAEQAGIPYEMGLLKNRYIGRTFIAPEQSMREFAVKIKLNPVKSLINGKRVVLVEDSIVRGTTLKYIVGLLRSVGAKEVHARISSPPYRFPCFYGIDTSSKGELIASGRDVEQVRQLIGADSLAYLDIQDLEDVLGNIAGGFCTACFTGEYPVGDITAYKKGK